MLTLESWAEQEARWPSSGRHILAQYDEQEIVVYQAYRPSIAKWAVEHGRFGRPRAELLTPSERVYPVAHPETRRRLGLDAA
jgi:hypothetical protein